MYLKQTEMKNTVSELSKDYCYTYSNGTWSVTCISRTFRLNNNGIKLIARCDEGLKKVVFDPDRYTITVEVANKVLSDRMPRIAYLSDDRQFFNELRENLETVLTTGTYASVKSNENRTVFEVE